MIWESFKSAFDRNDRQPVGTDVEQGPGTSFSQTQQQPSYEPVEPAPPAYSPAQHQPSSPTYPPAAYDFDRRKARPVPGYDIGSGQGRVPPSERRTPDEVQKKKEMKRAVFGLLAILLSAGIIFGVLTAMRTL